MGRGRTNEFDKESILAILQQHKEHMTGVSPWNVYSKEKGLPHSQTIIRYFGTWNQAKASLSLEPLKRGGNTLYTEEELLVYLEKYKDKFTTIYEWDDFAMQNQLPYYYTFTRNLGTDVVEEKTRIMVWDKEKLKKLIPQYFPDQPPTISKWKNIAKEHNLPSHMMIIRHFKSWSNMKYELYE